MMAEWTYSERGLSKGWADRHSPSNRPGSPAAYAARAAGDSHHASRPYGYVCRFHLRKPVVIFEPSLPRLLRFGWYWWSDGVQKSNAKWPARTHWCRSRLPLLGACNTRSSLGVSNAFTVVQKIALTAIVDQAHNSNERPRLRGPARRSRRLGKFCRIAFTRRSSSAQITSGGWGHVSLKLTWV